ncbi:ATP-binding protein [uncultured Bacteroides sp.]|uniref:hybrid sensor histidine kinase/response regulator n=1 Tax=uncultured Bacteroides sp. TaxID=162156 RepID=UPI0025E6011A|nr:ATP-binding protein [uncultured Bacteroides sp.]
MNSVSKVKITVGYTLLLGVLFFSLFFVHREMGNLMLSDNQDVQWTDSLIALLRKKDANNVYMLRVLSETNDSMVSTREVENLIAARQDSVAADRHVRHRIITHRDTVVTKPRKKGFFRRLGEVFVPPKKDSAIQVKTTLEYATDTVIDIYNPVDSLQEMLRAVAQQKKEDLAVMHRRRRTLQRMDKMLTARIDSLLKDYEQETLQRAREEADYRQSVRRHSARIISGIAAGAVLLSAFFLFIIGRDITRSNRYRRELEEARRRAEELLATREKMMLAITHDFKAPLGSIMGYADLLSRLTVDERQRFYLDNMKTSSEHLLKLVVDLLDFHRLDLHKAEINRVTFHPARLLEEIHVCFEPLASAKGLDLRCDIAPQLESTYISDPLRLRQIINNLLSNAVKFTDEGSVTMTAHYEHSRLVVAIADTGKGMEPADRERIFREFTRLPGAQGKEGFGLGLSIVRMLVQLLEGTIDVDSVPGKGSTFTLRVPLFPIRMPEHAGKQAEAADAEPVSVPVQSSLRVLLIDDDRIQLTLTASMLRQNGIASVSCMQTDELLDALRSDTFEVLLTDVQMPAINGFDLLKLLRASNLPQAQSIPVIAVTARSDMKPEAFKEHGFAGCLYKPFTVAELLRELSVAGIGQVSAPQEGETVGQQGAAVTRQAAVGAAVKIPFPNASYDFSALTAFSGDDPEAAKSILESFVTETRLNAGRLRQAVDAADMDAAAAVSHKMIPLFTLIGATELVAELKILEGLRGTPFTTEQGQRVLRVLALIEDIVRLQA